MHSMMPMHEVVRDTNVLVQLCDPAQGASYRLIRLIGTGAFTPNISVAPALEYEEVLKDSPVQMRMNFRSLFLRRRIWRLRFHSIRPSLADRDDEFVLDLAAQRGATILTYNKRDFAGAAKRGIDALTPAEFLGLLRQAK